MFIKKKIHKKKPGVSLKKIEEMRRRAHKALTEAKKMEKTKRAQEEPCNLLKADLFKIIDF